MHPLLALSFAIIVIGYLLLQLLLHTTQHKREPCLIESKLPFMDSAIGMMLRKTGYFEHLR